MALDEVARARGRSPATSTTADTVRVSFVLVAATGVMFASLGPSVTFGIHLLDQPLSFQNWAFAYPLGAIGLVGVPLLWTSLARRPIRAWPRAIWPLVLLLAWSLLSVVWSVLPDATGQRALTAVGIAAFAVWFGYELRFDEQLWALTLFAAASTIGSYMLIIWWPDVSRGLIGGYGWQGIFAGPNSLGPAAVIGILTAVGTAVRYRHQRRAAGAVVFASCTALAIANAVLLVQSTSVTAAAGLVAGGLAVAVVAVVRRLRTLGLSGPAVGAPLAVVVTASTAAVLANVGSIASFFGQDPTLASRTLIWSDVRDFISERPIEGYGYWAFWENLDLAGPSYERIGSSYGSAHNSVLEMALGLGAVGAVLFATIVVAAIVAVCSRVWRFGDLASIGWAVLLSIVLTEHLMESFVLWHSYVWILLIAAAFVPCSHEEQAARRRVRPGDAGAAAAVTVHGTPG